MYENTHLATRFLLSDAPLSLQGYIRHCNDTVWPLFSHLESAVQDGSNQREKAFGKKSQDVFQVIISLRWIKGGGIKHLEIFYSSFSLFLSVICFFLKDTYYNSKEVKLRFMNAMHSIAKVTGKAVATAFDLSKFKTACDIGGKERTKRCESVFLANKPFF